MQILQKVLEWSYLLLCFAIIWYAIALLSGLWRWILTRRGARQAAWYSAKLVLALVLVRGVIWLGMATTVS